jgi:DNA-binding MarR family transcriptional regulator
LADNTLPKDRLSTAGLRQLMLDGHQYRDVLARALKLGTNDLIAIFHVCLDGPLTPQQLGRRMGMTSGTMTALLDRVENAGFLTRKHNPEDRRSLLITATPAGEDAIDWTNQQFGAVIELALAEVPDVTPEQFDSVITALSRALEKSAEGAQD